MAVLAGGVFVIDLLTPLGVADAVLYVGLVLFSLWSPQRRFTLIVAGGSTALTVLGYFVSPPGGVLWMSIANRILIVFMIWMTAILVLRYKQKQAEIKVLRELLPICASCKRIRDVQGYWKDLVQYIEQHSEVQFTHGICSDCLAKWYPELNPEHSGRDPEASQKEK
jgi:hypothetical protein